MLYYYIPENKYFHSRKELKDYLGANRYKQALKHYSIKFISNNNPNTIAFYGNNISTIKEGNK